MLFVFNFDASNRRPIQNCTSPRCVRRTTNLMKDVTTNEDLTSLFANQDHQNLCRWILTSFEISSGRKMVEDLNSTDGYTIAERLFHHAPLILAHDRVNDESTVDNRFTYGNKTALDTFGLTLAGFRTLASKKTTTDDSEAQRARNELLGNAILLGPRKLTGLERSLNGVPILIEDSFFFNIVDERGIYRGQSICVDKFKFL